MAVSARTRWTATAASAAFNLLLIAGVAQLGAKSGEVWVEEPAMVVSLVSAPGGATPTPGLSAADPHTEPSPTPPLALPVHLAPTPEAAPTPRYVSEAPEVASVAAAMVAAVAAPRAAAPPQRAGTRDGLDIEAVGGTSNDYASRLRAWLEAHKTYPRRARMRREEGVVHIRFAVDRRGHLLTGDVTRSSGYEALDAEAMAMLGRSDPFPSAPHSVRGERIEVSTPVEFALER